jgi:MFS family permease
MFLTGLSRTYTELLIFQLITAVGIGSISSVGFSVVSDFISPVRRGLAMSIWGLSQGGGAGTGALLGGLLGANFWPLPFFVVAAAGLIFAVLYLFTFEPERGRAEPELASVFESGGRYHHRIHWTDIRTIMAKRSNVWLMLQAFLATLVYGSLVWMPRLFIARVQSAGYGLETSTISGNLYSLLFQMGFYFAILTGHLGDRWQRRTPGGLARLSMMAMWIAIPFQIAVFFVPMIGLMLPEGGTVIAVTMATIISIVSNPWIAVTFVLALLAVAFSSADLANRRAILSDVNLPEHRGTVIGILSIAVGTGLALGNALGGLASDYFLTIVGTPLNYAVALALFQLIFIPAGFCYYQLSKTTAQDIGDMRRTLAERAKER